MHPTTPLLPLGLVSLVMVALVAAGAGVAADAALEGWTHEGVFDPAVGAGVLGALHRFTLDLDAGQVLAVRVTWDAPWADLDLLLHAPQAGCDLLAPDCLLGEDGPVQGATCPPEDAVASMHLGLGPAQEAFRTTIPRAGPHEVWLHVGLGAPAMPVAYTVTIDVDEGQTPVVQAQEPTWLLVGSPHCKVVQALAG